MSRKKRESLLDVAGNGSLSKLLSHYLEECRQAKDSVTGKPERRFPNLAGFCRFVGCGVSEADALKSTDAEQYDFLCAVLEDEALNALLSPTVISAYLKRRLGYAEKSETATQTDCGEMRLIFEHDIAQDGS